MFSWDINLRWEVETDLDRHGDGWEQMRAAIGSDDGWGGELRLYAGTFAAR